MWVCYKCKKKFEVEELAFVRCPECGSKVFFKATPTTPKKVSTE
jgi:DNA-directed RNA polymerase subunit RPC12/RpoP